MFKMRFIVCAFAILALCMSLATISVAAEGFAVPGDLDGNKIVSQEELEIAEQEYRDGKITSDRLEEIRHVHENYPINITDSVGNEVTIWKPLRRIVVFNGETVETMRSLGGQDKIIGVGKYTAEDVRFFPELSKLPAVGSVWSPDVEAVLELYPDAVFIYGNFSRSKADDIQQTLESADPDIVVVRLDCFKPENYIDEVRKLGVILEQEDEAENFLDFYQDCLDQVSEVVGSLSEEDKPLVYLESWTDYKTGAEGSGWHPKLVMAGGHNIFEDASIAYPLIDPESVVTRDPEIVIKLCGAGGLKFGGYNEGDAASDMEALQDTVMSRPAWDTITAVKDDRVYVLSNDILGGAQHFIGIAYLAKTLHPTLFEEMDPNVIHQEYLTRFQGLDYDIDEEGVFIYPKIQ
ncbi:MAG: ABC transporter substrate-binding protein [Euryarchaeota archaeon]|nr:ABC transporter substrate-binding protein [Euryarchaeota archaeon]